MNRLLTLVALSALPFLAGCINISKTAENTPAEILNPSSQLVGMSSPELEAQHAAIAAQIEAIERDVEFKAGLHMGVSIGDDRGRLNELYAQNRAIERELVRRSAYTKL